MRTPEPLSHARPHRKVLLDPGTLEVWIPDHFTSFYNRTALVVDVADG